MSRFKLLRYECPGCSGVKKGCYTNGSIFGCKLSVEGAIGGKYEPILEKNGYVHKQDKLGVFYLYREKIFGDKNWTEADKESL